MKELQFIIKNGETETVLTHSPDGWDSTLLEIDRDPNFLGVVRSYSVDLKFVLDGAELLRDIFYKRIQNETFLTVQKLDAIALTYSDVYTGQIDFSTFNDTIYSVSVKLTDMSLSNVIKKNIGIKYSTNVPAEDRTILNFEKFPTGYEFGKSVETIKISDFLENIFDKVTEGKYSSGVFGLDMSVLTNLEVTTQQILITNAMALTGARFDRVDISFSDYIKLLFVIYNVVISVEIIGGKETLRLLLTPHSFPGDTFASITAISNVKISIAKDFIYNTVNVGHNEEDYDSDIDLSKEIGTSYIFGNDSGFVGSQELNLQTGFNADTISIKKYFDMYGVTVEGETLDYTQFIIEATPKTITDVPFIAEYGYVGTSAVLGDRTQLNTWISPRRLIGKHERFINSCFFGNSTQIKYISSPLNAASLFSCPPFLTSPTAEGATFTRYAGRDFVPLYIEFEGMLPESLDFTSLYNPENSKLSFEYNGETFTGFLMNIKAGLYGKKKASFKLLCSPENDLTKLIH